MVHEGLRPKGLMLLSTAGKSHAVLETKAYHSICVLIKVNDMAGLDETSFVLSLHFPRYQIGLALLKACNKPCVGLG